MGNNLGPAALMDILIAPVWLGVNALLVFACYRLARRLYPTHGLLQRILHTVIACWACITQAALILGFIGALTGYALLGTVAGVALLILYIIHLSPMRPTHHLAAESATTALPSANLATLRSFALGPQTPDALPIDQPAKCHPVWLGIWSLLLTSCLAYVASHGLLAFPSDWDSLAYHIPLIDQWLQARSLYAPDSAHWFFPGNNELLGLWAVAPFSGDYLIALTNLPATMLLALATIELASISGLPSTISHLTALTVVANFVVKNQLIDSENDVAAASLFLASISYGLRYTQTTRPTDLTFGAISLGLLAGIKFYTLPSAAVVWGTVVIIMLLGTKGLQISLRAIGFGLLGVLLWGGYWYVRNSWWTGILLYPYDIPSMHTVLGRDLPDVWKSTFIGNGRPEILPLSVSALWRFTGPFQAVSVLISPLVIGWMAVRGIWLFKVKAASLQGQLRVVLGALVLGSALIILVTPATVEDEPGTLNHLIAGYGPIRYGLSFLCISIVSAVVFLYDLSQLVPSLMPVHNVGGWISQWFASNLCLVLGCSLGLELVDSIERARDGVIGESLLYGLMVWCVGVAFYLLWRFCVRVRGAIGVVGGVATVAAVVAVNSTIMSRWHKDFSGYYDRMFNTQAFTALEKKAPKARICLVGAERCLPFIGSYRQFRPLHLYDDVSYSSLIHFLKAEGITLVAIRLDDNPWARSATGDWDWLKEHSSVLVAVEESPTIGVYEVQGGWGD